MIGNMDAVKTALVYLKKLKIQDVNAAIMKQEKRE